MKKLISVIKKSYVVITRMLVLCIACVSLNTFAQTQPINPDLSGSNRFQVVNRGISISTDKAGKAMVHLDGKPNPGVAWINDLTFGSGIIEFDVKGKNIMQQSFVGIAFHGLNDSSYEAIYFRPLIFNPLILQEEVIQYNISRFRNMIGHCYAKCTRASMKIL
ncbi:MAG: hypothetical protein JWQ09_3846 [Segetibacter sp.]|nr:hypothetical protein [Segetibacter sp.]